MCVTSDGVYQVAGKIHPRPSAAERFSQADPTDGSSKLCCVYSASVNRRLIRFTATIWLLGKAWHTFCSAFILGPAASNPSGDMPHNWSLQTFAQFLKLWSEDFILYPALIHLKFYFQCWKTSTVLILRNRFWISALDTWLRLCISRCGDERNV